MKIAMIDDKETAMIDCIPEGDEESQILADCILKGCSSDGIILWLPVYE